MDNNTGPLASTYVWNGGKCFLVSTINRQSSSAINPNVYAETMVFEVDPTTRSRLGSPLQITDGLAGSIKPHIQIVERIHQSGANFEEDGE